MRSRNCLAMRSRNCLAIDINVGYALNQCNGLADFGGTRSQSWPGEAVAVIKCKAPLWKCSAASYWRFSRPSPAQRRGIASVSWAAGPTRRP